MHHAFLKGKFVEKRVIEQRQCWYEEDNGSPDEGVPVLLVMHNLIDYFLKVLFHEPPSVKKQLAAGQK